MDAFGWSTQYAAEPCPPSGPSDDGLLSAFLSASFDDGLRADHGGLHLPSSHPVPCHDGVPGPFLDLDAAGVLQSSTGAVDNSLLDTFAPYVPNVDDENAQAAASNAAFSGYSSTTGGNISSGESNTCGGGGHDTEVASPCAVSRPRATTTLPPSKPKLYRYATLAALATTATEATAERPRGTKRPAATSSSTSITFGGQSRRHQHAEAAAGAPPSQPDTEAMALVKEMIYRAAAMRPVHQLVCGGAGAEAPPESRPRRKNVRISSDPQTVAARQRRERVSERLRVLQRLVPGGSRMDTASMLEEAASYLKFLKSQLKALEGGSPSNSSYHSGSLPQNYTGGIGGTSASTVLAFGRDGSVGTGYVKSNRNMQL